MNINSETVSSEIVKKNPFIRIFISSSEYIRNKKIFLANIAFKPRVPSIGQCCEVFLFSEFI